MFWNNTYKKQMIELESQLRCSEAEEERLRKENILLKSHRGSMADLMRESLGMSVDFSAADTKTCLPPHFLEGKSEEERKNFISDMETIHSNERFREIVTYMINLFALNVVYKADPEEMKRNQAAVVGFRTLLKEFDKMHLEYLGYQKIDNGEFDPHAPLPE